MAERMAGDNPGGAARASEQGRLGQVSEGRRGREGGAGGRGEGTKAARWWRSGGQWYERTAGALNTSPAAAAAPMAMLEHGANTGHKRRYVAATAPYPVAAAAAPLAR